MSHSQVNLKSSACLSRAVIEETSFVGAYERVRLRMDPAGTAASEPGDSPYLLTTETPDRPTGKPIIATRPKPVALSSPLRIRDRVFIGLITFYDPSRYQTFVITERNGLPSRTV